MADKVCNREDGDGPADVDAKCQFRIPSCSGLSNPPRTGSFVWDEDEGGEKGRMCASYCDKRRDEWMTKCNAPYVECRGCSDPSKKGIVFSESCFKKDDSACKCVLETKEDGKWKAHRRSSNKDYSAGQLSYEHCRNLHRSIFGGKGGEGGEEKGGQNDGADTKTPNPSPSGFMKSVNKEMESSLSSAKEMKTHLKEMKDLGGEFKSLFHSFHDSSSPHKGPSASAHAKR